MNFVANERNQCYELQSSGCYRTKLRGVGVTAEPSIFTNSEGDLGTDQKTVKEFSLFGTQLVLYLEQLGSSS